MSAPIESIAAMTDQADADDTTPVDLEPRPPAQPPHEASPKADMVHEAHAAPAVAGAAGPSDQTGAVPQAPGAVAAGALRREPRSVSPNAIIGLLGTLLAGVLLWALTYMSSQMNSLGDRIDGLGNKIDQVHNELDTKIDTEISELRAEMRDSFREVNATLLDHTERLARLETTAGLSRPAEDDAGDEPNDDNGG